MLSLIRPKNPYVFLVALLFVGTLGLFTPTPIVLGPGSVSGRVHVYLAYIGLVVLPGSLSTAWPIVVTHALATCMVAWILDRLVAASRPST
jgi:hypothetical protein